MEYKNEIVNYNDKNYYVLEILKLLEISRNLYYAKRKKGLLPQEAFLACLDVKTKKEKIGKFNVSETSLKNGISPRIIYNALYNDENLDTTIAEQKEKKEKKTQNLEYLYKIGLPEEYKSLTEFCNKERLDMKIIHYNIQKGFSLYDAIVKSLTINSVARKYTYCSLQLKAIALKYGLDINRLRFWLRKDCNYMEAIEKEVFARTFSENIGHRFNYLWGIYHAEYLNKIDIQNKVTESELNKFGLIYSKMFIIKRDFVYYFFLDNVLKNISIEELKQLDIDDRVRNILLAYNIPFTLNELYYVLDFENGLMKDFEYNSKYNIWTFSGNREVLKKIKRID